MARVSRQQLQRLVDRIITLQNRPAKSYVRTAEGKNVAQVGHIHLDHAAVYGGWDLVEVLTTSGGQESMIGNTFGGRGRVNAHEMETFLLGMLHALEIKPANQRPPHYTEAIEAA